MSALHVVKLNSKILFFLIYWKLFFPETPNSIFMAHFAPLMDCCPERLSLGIKKPPADRKVDRGPAQVHFEWDLQDCDLFLTPRP